MNSKKKVFVGMSGGVDSSVAAMLLRDAGHDVVGVFMRCYNLDGCANQDAEDARRAAEHLGIPFYVWDFEDAYKARVMDYMIEGYRAGITPNPDVMCNREIKFGLFLEKALAAGADYVATGHYVRKVSGQQAGTPPLRTASDYSLFVAEDKNKDQSYFLWTLTQAQLAYCLFPIGDYRKPAVRELARASGLPTAEKKDSQGICFLGNITIADFLKQYIPEHAGALVTAAGEPIGEHSGAEFYTIGQRHLDAHFAFPKTGAGGAARAPFYVAAKDAATNTVVVAEGSGHEALHKREVELTNCNVIGSEGAPGPVLEASRAGLSVSLEVLARVRYRQPLFPAQLLRKENGNYQLAFDEPQKFIAPGQSAVWYAKDGEMLGGGVIV